MSLTRLLRGLGLLVVAGFGLLAFTPLPNRWQAATAVEPRLQPADAVVVLGAGVSQHGVLGQHSQRRAVEGVRLYHLGLAPQILLMGPGHHGGPTEASVRASLAQELGVPERALELEARGTTTRYEAQLAWERLGRQGRRRVLLVTGSFHMPRARALFVRAGFEVLPAPTADIDPDADQPLDRLALARGLIQELLARAYYRTLGYL